MRLFSRRRQSDLSLNDPLLAEEDGSAETYRQFGELDTLVARFGRSLLNVSPRDISRLQEAVENDSAEEISKLIGHPDASTNPTGNETDFSSIDMSQNSLFKMAVDNCKTEWVEFFLEKIGDKSIPFDVAASMMKESFNDLWLEYKILVEDMMKKDVLGWDICTIEVPLETFTVEANLGCRVGTCDTITEWISCSRQGTALEHWRALNKKSTHKVLKKSKGMKVNAIVRVFCFEDACQIGLDGIIRSLLLNRTPCSVFKNPLIKWTILFKWERIWKTVALKKFALFLVFFTAFHLLVMFSANLHDYYFEVTSRGRSFLIVETVILVWMPILSLRREILQLKRYICDCQKIFGSGCFRGIIFYFSSTENVIDLVLSCFMIYCVVVLSFFLIENLRYLGSLFFFASLAFEVLLMWAKAFYYVQAFKRSGIFVLMIGRVLQECAPYFFMLIGLVLGFGLAMHAVCVDFILKNYFEGYWGGAYRISESADNVVATFGTLPESILTMVSAMAGLYDPQDLISNGPLGWLMISIFIIYLFFQTIIMFNLLIASMGDAFDGVRAEEEELFLMARAMFIDQYEASLSKTEVQILQKEIGKYLYVLTLEDKRLEMAVSSWKGRIPTIKEDMTKIVMDSKNQQSQNMNELFKTLREDMKSLKEEIMTLKQRISDQESSQ